MSCLEVNGAGKALLGAGIPALGWGWAQVGGWQSCPPTALCILQCVGAAAVVQSCLLRCKMGDPHCSASWLMFLMRVRGTEECLGMCGFR